MAITRITKGVIKPNENYDTHNIVSTGIITSVGADINGDLDVDGHTNLDNVSISGVTTFAGSVNNLVLSGVVTTTGLDVNGNADISGNMSVGGVLTYEDVTSIDSVGIITARNDIHVGAGVSAVGVGTFGSLDIGGDIDVDGHTELDNLNVTGVTTFNDNVHLKLNDRLQFGNGNELEIYQQGNNSFILNNDDNFIIGQQGNGTAHPLKIYGGTTLELKHYYSNGGQQFLLNSVRGAQTEIYYSGTKKFETSSTGITVSGTVVATGADINGDIDVDGHTNLDNVSIAGVSTFAGAIDLNADLDVDGHTNLDNVSVAGVSTFSGNILPGTDSSHNIGSNSVRFANVYGDALYGVIQNTTHTNITRVGTLSQLAVSGTANPLNVTHTGANCINLNRGSKSIGIDVNYGGSDTHSLVSLTTGMDLRFKLGGADRIVFKSAGHIEPQTDSQINLGSNTVRFANIYADTLYGDGSNLTGVTSVGGNTGVDFNDNVKARFGNTNDLVIYYENGGADRGKIGTVNNRPLDLLTNNTQRIVIENSGHVRPAINNSYDLGTGGDRWRNVYGVGGNFSGTVTANAFSGDGSNLTGLSVGIAGISTTGTSVFNNVTVSGISTINSLIVENYDGSGNSGIMTVPWKLGQSYSGGGAGGGTSNQVWGQFAGQNLSLSAAVQNVIIGREAAKGLDRGDSNVFIGCQAGPYNDGNNYENCDNNTVVSGYSMYFAGGNAKGNSVFGYHASYDLRGAQFNTTVGYAAAKNVMNGGECVVIGHSAAEGSSAYHPNSLVAIGASAAKNITSAQNVIVIGNNANPSSNTPSNEITLGDSDINHFRVPGIGVSFSAGGGVVTGIMTASSFKLLDGSAVGGFDPDAQNNLVAGNYAGDGFSGTSAEHNITFGYQAGTNISTGDKNICIGRDAGRNLTNTNENVFIGDGTGNSWSGGQRNVCVGPTAGWRIGGSYNVFLGHSSGGALTGHYNIAIGQYAGGINGGSVNTGSNNIFIGRNTHEYQGSSQEKNTIIGNYACQGSSGNEHTGDNNLILGYNAQPSSNTVSNEITLGDTNITKLRVPALNFVLKSSTATQGHVLTVDGNGEAGFAALSSSEFTTDSNNNLVAGVGAFEGTGIRNIALGREALDDGTTAEHSVAIGFQSLFVATTGSYNTAVGYQTLLRCTTGEYNAAYGYLPMQQVTTGKHNVGMGSYALNAATTGWNNIGIGREAGRNITTGNGNICIGLFAEASSATANYEVTIGNSSITKFRIPGINVTLKDNGGTPTQGHVLTVDGNGEAGFAAVSSDLVNDTSPQLGGDLDTNSFHINLDDDHAVRFGDSNDLQIYHNNSANTNEFTSALSTNFRGKNLYFYVANNVSSESAIMAYANAQVELYHDDSKKFETQSTGAKVTGTLHTSSNVRISGELDLGTANGNKFMDVCLGDNYGFYLRSTSGEGANHEALARFERNRGAILYWDANTRFETTTDGVQVTGEVVSGTLHCSGKLDLPDSPNATVGRVLFGDSDDLQIYHGGGNSYLRNSTGIMHVGGTGGDLVLEALGDVRTVTWEGENMIYAKRNGAVELYYDNSKKAETVSGGFTVTGDLTATGFVDSSSDIKLKTNIKTIDNALDKVLQLRGAEYDRIDRDNQHEIGVIAQEVEKIIPEVVHGDETKTVSYGNMVAVLIEAIKEQNEVINKMKKEIEDLKG